MSCYNFTTQSVFMIFVSQSRLSFPLSLEYKSSGINNQSVMMEALKQQQRREAVRDFMLLNPSTSNIVMVNHFQQQGYSRASIYRYIKRIRECNETKSRHAGGKQVPQLDENLKRKIRRFFDNKVGASLRKASLKFKVCRQVITKWLDQLGIKRKKRKKVPKTSDRQKKKQQVILNKISREEFRASNDDVDVIMDDETYLDENGNQFGGNQYYYERQRHEVPEEVKYIPKTKFPFKLMVWVAISKKGRSKFYFRRQEEGAVTGNIYKNECIVKRLIPFIRKNYPHDNYLFWPDLASSHYAEPVRKVYEKEKINVLPKNRNPPNVPQLRPIETFWANFKAVVYENGYQPKNIDELESKAKKAIKKFDEKYFERLMTDVRRTVRAAATKGPLSVINQ